MGIHADVPVPIKPVKHYNEAIELCASLKDHGTREVLEPILTESEEHVDWPETQLGLIEARMRLPLLQCHPTWNR